MRFPIALKGHAVHFAFDIERLNLDAREHLGAVRAGHPFQIAGHSAHAARGHFPLAGFVADEVVKEATVLQQRRVVGMREHADFCVGKYAAAEQVVAQVALDGGAQRLFHETPPRFAMSLVRIEAPLQFAFGHERFEHRVPHHFREGPRESIEPLELVVFGFAAGQLRDGFPTDILGHVAHQKSVVPAIPDIGRVGTGCAPAQIKVQAEVSDDFFREQADQIGVARKMGIVVRKNFLRGRATADVIIFLQQ